MYRSVVIDVKSKDHHLVVSKVNLKLKFWKGDYLPESYDVGRLQDENFRETFQEELNTKLESLKLTMWKMGGIILEKQLVELLMVSQGRQLRLQLGILVKKLLCLIESRRGLYKNYLSDR